MSQGVFPSAGSEGISITACTRAPGSPHGRPEAALYGLRFTRGGPHPGRQRCRVTSSSTSAAASALDHEDFARDTIAEIGRRSARRRSSGIERRGGLLVARSSFTRHRGTADCVFVETGSSVRGAKRSGGFPQQLRMKLRLVGQREFLKSLKEWRTRNGETEDHSANLLVVFDREAKDQRRRIPRPGNALPGSDRTRVGLRRPSAVFQVPSQRGGNPEAHEAPARGAPENLSGRGPPTGKEWGSGGDDLAAALPGRAWPSGSWRVDGRERRLSVLRKCDVIF